MILQALYDYYQRKATDPDPARRLPSFGLEEKEIPFIIEIAADGRPVAIKDTRQGEGKKKQARRYLVPKGIKKTSGVAANLLWDSAEYVLGIDTKGKPERVIEQHAAFRQRLSEFPLPIRDDAGLQAIDAFYSSYGHAALADDLLWSEILETNPVMTFRLVGDSDLVCQRPALVVSLGSTRMAVATETEAEKQQGDNRTMGRKHTVPYGLYVAHGFVSAFLAKQNGFDENDLELLWQSLEQMFEHDRSAARGEMSTRSLFVFKHDSELGNAHAHSLFERVRIVRKSGVDVPRSFADYEVSVDAGALPPGVTLIKRV